MKYKIISSSVLLIALAFGTLSVIIGILEYGIRKYRKDILDEDNRIEDVGKNIRKKYDFIVVGGGTAGCILANRLSENHKWKILLLEAGKDETALSEVPIISGAQKLTDADWQYMTEPSEKFCQAMENYQCTLPRGKSLGGSSALNDLMYIRGNKKDYDYWAEMGNKGWSSKEVLKYFKKMEDNKIPGLDSKYHGEGGPMTVESFRYQSPIAKAFAKACEEIGLYEVDVNGGKQIGYTYTPGTLRNGLRCSTAKAYLRPAKHRSNLHVSMDSHVTKLIMKKKKVVGVKFTKGKDENYKVYATKEVILSAGSYNTPKILMLSGIGPADHLKDLDIDVVADLQVGMNLQSHVALAGAIYFLQKPVAYVLQNEITLKNVKNFLYDGKGALYGNPEGEVLAFVQTKYAEEYSKLPDILLYVASFSDCSDGGIQGKRNQGLTDKVYKETCEGYLNKHSYSIVHVLMRPESRGHIELRSRDPKDAPKIFPNYFSDPRDIKTIREGAKIGFSLSQTNAMKKLGAYINPNPLPGCKKIKFLSDKYWECAAKQRTMTISHPVGTAKMGPKDDHTAVVGPTLKVHGIKCLRVCDDSIMPSIVTGNTAITTMMIAEKCADMIKEDYEKEDYDENSSEEGYDNEDYENDNSEDEDYQNHKYGNKNNEYEDYRKEDNEVENPAIEGEVKTEE